ncbi:recombinase RecT [Streptomyces sp. H27-H5]|uniref:recombinase RecT n=1 Tax=Streptomyces sp. H27-H5 TaxID=2996460 RepID=UPI002270B16A|nr:recombinase RecT [Streptomyces sp. H27-H5]MCY0957658.1 recombinase RecT [Streptomyces sp. H27-H5]
MTSLKDRVKAATDRGTSVSGPALEDVRHDRAADGQEETPAGHEPDTSEGDMKWLRRYEEHIREALPAHMELAPFLGAVRSALPSVARCSPASKLQAILTAARFGLAPDGKLAVFRGDGPQATFIPTYRGYIHQMDRPDVDVIVGFIYANEEWSYEPSAPFPLDFTHKARPDLSEEQRGAPILAYAFARKRGGSRSTVILLNREDAEEIRDQYSVAYQRAEESGKRDSFWHTHFLDMWLKSSIRRLAKYVKTTPGARALDEVEDAGEAGQVQILLAPGPEDAGLVTDAERAHRAAEATQDPARPGSVALPVKGRSGRSKPKRRRGGPR